MDDFVENSTADVEVELYGIDAFCGEHFWDDAAFHSDSFPVFTQCFQHTVFIWIPCLFLTLFSPVIACQLLIEKSNPLPWSQLICAKVILSCILLADSAFLLVVALYEAIVLDSLIAVNFVHPISLLCAMAVILAFIVACQKYGKVTSGGLFLTWLLFAIFGVPELHWWVHIGLNPSKMPLIDVPRYTAFLVWYGCVIVQVALFAFADKPSEYKVVGSENASPELTASFLSRQTMWWFNQICAVGIRKPLETHDLYSLNPENTSAVLVPKWNKVWDKAMAEYNVALEEWEARKRSEAKSSYLSKSPPVVVPARSSSLPATDFHEESILDRENGMPKPPSIFMTLFRLFKYEIISSMLIKLVADLLQFANPWLLKRLIQFTESPTWPTWYGVVLALLMFASSEFGSLLLNHYYYVMFGVGTRLFTCLSAAVYRKTLRLSSAARRDKTVGEVVNLMAIDVDRIQQLTPQSHQFWSIPLQISIALYLLWSQIGIAVVSGLAVMLVLFPLNFCITMAIRCWQVEQMNAKDERTKMMSEVLNGMKVIKLYAWEPPMEKVITDLRDRELRYIKRTAITWALSDIVSTACPFLVALSTFATYVMIDEKNVLTPEIAFVSLALFNQLRAPMCTVAELISQTVQVVVSNRRLREFLIAPELSSYVNARRRSDGDDLAVDVEKASLSWEPNSAPFLKDVTIRLRKGGLLAIVGRVGSGKSSLLQSLLGEMERLQGQLTVIGHVAYVPQQPWMQNATLRQNVLFGRRFEEYFYGRVLDACALYPDLAMLANGDRTEIGEKGINLSGGQKARIGLARAVYQNFDVYLLDDPLAALDSHVGAKIFYSVIGPEGMLRNKTRILVTHEPSYLKYADYVLVLSNGGIAAEGTYAELMASDGAFKQLLEDCETERREKQSKMAADEEELQDEDLSDGSADVEETMRPESPMVDQLLGSSHVSTISGIALRSRYAASQKVRHRRGAAAGKHGMTSATGAPVDSSKQLIHAERVETGRVKARIYLQYFRSMSLIIFGVFVICMVASTAASMVRNLWLTDWSNANSNSPTGGDTQTVGTRLMVYGALGFVEVVLLFGGMFALLVGGVSASRNLHAPLIRSILRAPTSFFDTTPFGRILNRVGRDIETIDMLLPYNVQFFTYCLLEVLSTLAIVMISTPVFGAVAIPLAVMYFLVLGYYIATSRQLKRLESTTLSPVFSYLGESIQGGSTIRAFNNVERFCNQSESRIDSHIQVRYLNYVANRWLSVRLEFIGNCVMLFAALFAALTRNNTSAGVIGLSVTYSLSITFVLNFAVRQIGKLETNIVSVERVKEYADTPSEAPWESEPNRKPADDWPNSGRVELRRYSTRYRPGLDLVLKRLDASIRAHEKVGIVGRTGAGKSSIALALFRIIEPAEGAIFIDGVDISRIGLHDLRGSLSIIPQDPVLFSGTLRFNLDPLGAYSDSEIWLALEYAHLKEFALSVPDRLLYQITEGGENISLGQRQLVCLARALLRKSRVLVLDEATAAVDLATDALIQRTIRDAFQQSTVLTIAHRLNTILDCDRIVVLDRGEIREFDAPAALLANRASIFHSMAISAGINPEARNGSRRRSPPLERRTADS